MAVTTTYALFVAPQLESFGGGVRDFDMTELANGGLLVTGIDPGDLDRPLRYGAYNTAGQLQVSYGELQDLQSGSVTTLTNGNLVIASLGNHDGAPGGDIGFKVLHGVTRAPIKDWTYEVVDNAANVQVAALTGGGFVVAADMASSETDHDIALRLYDAAGELLATPFINSDFLDEKPTIAVLDDGKISISWQMTTDFGVSVMNALLSADGLTYIQSPHGVEVVDDDPDVQSIATDDGYALVYRDGVDLVMTTFDSAGLQIDTANLTDNLPNACRDVALTRLDNGMIAYSYSYDFQPGDHDVYMQVIDPGTLTKLFAGEQIITQELDDERASVIQDFGDGRFALAWNHGGDAGKGATFGLQRTIRGDNAANSLIGDDAVDLMSGGKGADTLRAGGNHDQLRGEFDKDVLYGGRGNDVLIGGVGGDTMSGQTGKDVFLFEGLKDSSIRAPDRITDLSDQDQINLKAIDADVNVDGDQRFRLVDAFTDHAREAVLVFHTTGRFAGTTTLQLDVNGDGVADFRLIIDGDHADFSRFAL